MTTISEIQDYLMKHHKGEDKIPDKSKNRVYRSLAASVKENKPLSKGRCNLCGIETDRRLPIPMKLCPACVNKFMQRGGGLEVVSKNFEEHICDFCMVRTFIVFQANPRVCQRCSKIIGNKYKKQKDELIAKKKFIERQRKRHGLK